VLSCWTAKVIQTYDFLLIHRTCDYKLNLHYCVQFRSSIRVRIRFSVWLASRGQGRTEPPGWLALAGWAGWSAGQVGRHVKCL